MQSLTISENQKMGVTDTLRTVLKKRKKERHTQNSEMREVAVEITIVKATLAVSVTAVTMMKAITMSNCTTK